MTLLRTRTSWPLAGAALALAFAALAQPADAAAPRFAFPGAFGITPARRHIVATPGLELTPTTVANTSSTPFRVSVLPVLLTQDLTGAYNFTETRANLSAARRILSAGPERFTLPPGAQRKVAVRWNALPAGTRSLAIGIVFQGFASHQKGPVSVVDRLLSVNFLSAPGSIPVSGEFTRLGGEQFGRGVLRFLVRVHNTGARVWAPSHCLLVIRNSLGVTVFRSRWTGDVVIPGAQRDFPVDVTRSLPAGSYTATAQMTFKPGSHETITSGFTLVGPNQLPTPKVAVHNLNATGEIGGTTNITGSVASTGTAPATIRLHLTLLKINPAGSQRTLATKTISYTRLAPGQTRSLARSMGGSLTAGSYDVYATWTAPDGSAQTMEAAFTAVPGRSLLSQFWDLVTRHMKLIVSLLALLLVAAGALAYRLDRRRRDLIAELDAAIGILGAPDAAGEPARELADD